MVKTADLKIDEKCRCQKVMKIDENSRNLNWWNTKLMKIDETNRNPKLMKIWWKSTLMKTAEAQNWCKRPKPKSDENLWKRQKPKLTKHKLMKIDETNRNPKLMKLILMKIDEYWGQLKFMKNAKAWKMMIPSGDKNWWKGQKP